MFYSFINSAIISKVYQHVGYTLILNFVCFAGIPIVLLKDTMEVFLSKEFHVFLVQNTIAILIVPDFSPGSKGNSVLCRSPIIVFLFVYLSVSQLRINGTSLAESAIITPPFLRN